MGIDALGGRNNHACLLTVEILVVASENGKIKLKLHKFTPLLRPRKSNLADFGKKQHICCTSISCLCRSGDVYSLEKSAVEYFQACSTMLKIALFLPQLRLLETNLIFLVRLTQFSTMLISWVKYNTSISVSTNSFVIYPCKEIQ